MKGIILHGGYGTRLGPLTLSGPKQLLPIANKAMSQYALEDLKNIGITEIAIIIGDVHPEKVQNFYGDGSKFGVKITYIFQKKPLGISHAIRLCKDFVGKDSFVVYLGDNILRKGLKDYMRTFNESHSDAFILLCKVDDPSRFGIAEISGTVIKKVIEKPKKPKSDLAIIGVYFFTPIIFDIIDQQKPSWRNELEVTDSIQKLLEIGKTVKYDVVNGWWKDTGTPEDILHANRLILDTISKNEDKTEKKNSFGKDNIIIGKNSKISKDSEIIGPVIIGNDCIINTKTKIGPYVSIGSNTQIENSEIINSIIMDDCKLANIKMLENSIIGNSCKILKDEKKFTELLLGEKSQIRY